jgi:surfeit locus 1 family protein
MKRWPIIPTIIVIIAVGIMIGLGVWQLQRKAEKEAMLARYNAADGLSFLIPRHCRCFGVRRSCAPR